MASRTLPITNEDDLLAAAQGGDDGAFRRLLEPRRAELHAHCYRMLGSVHDADDALQDTFLRAWRGLASFKGDSSLRRWLYRIATNAAIDIIGRRPDRVLPVDYGPPSGPEDGPGEPLVERVWVEPYPDEVLGLPEGRATPEARFEQREAVELAFVAALQHLPARQRAALVLCEVLGFSAREAAQTLDTTVASINSALQRARRTIDEQLPQRGRQGTLRAVDDHETRAVVQRYLDAWERRDIDAIATMLAEDATFAMPPNRNWWRGREAVIAFMRSTEGLCAPARHVWTWANGQPAVAYYSQDAETGRYRATAIEITTVENGEVKAITSFVTPEIFPRFGLPAELEP